MIIYRLKNAPYETRLYRPTSVNGWKLLVVPHTAYRLEYTTKFHTGTQLLRKHAYCCGWLRSYSGIKRLYNFYKSIGLFETQEDVDQFMEACYTSINRYMKKKVRITKSMSIKK